MTWICNAIWIYNKWWPSKILTIQHPKTGLKAWMLDIFGLVFKQWSELRTEMSEFETKRGQIDTILFYYVLVWYSNGRPTTWISNHLKSELQKVWYSKSFRYSNVSGIQMVCIQIPTVYKHIFIIEQSSLLFKSTTQF